MQEKTKVLWEKQDRHPGDRWRLFQAINHALQVESALYPGCYVDVAPSFVFPSVTYVDEDRRAAVFFSDVAGVQEIIANHGSIASEVPEWTFIHGNYSGELGLQEQSFDLLISLYAGFISESCTQYLKIGGTLLVNPSHGDAALASIDQRYRLTGVVTSSSGRYQVKTTDLDRFLVPKKPNTVTKELIHKSGRGIGYTKSPFAYLFLRID